MVFDVHLIYIDNGLPGTDTTYTEKRILSTRPSELEGWSGYCCRESMRIQYDLEMTLISLIIDSTEV